MAVIQYDNIVFERISRLESLAIAMASERLGGMSVRCRHPLRL